jgi:hypothetical protein
MEREATYLSAVKPWCARDLGTQLPTTELLHEVAVGLPVSQHACTVQVATAEAVHVLCTKNVDTLRNEPGKGTTVGAPLTLH